MKVRMGRFVGLLLSAVLFLSGQVSALSIDLWDEEEHFVQGPEGERVQEKDPTAGAAEKASVLEGETLSSLPGAVSFEEERQEIDLMRPPKGDIGTLEEAEDRAIAGEEEIALVPAL